ncbi:hypothetical protein FN846DRAFT_891526 [Sphaerosporella brunnea]|uniref:Uncharacterized protein n=1 Tax=Sphaerosporella brunnea TaxID=1250544 RepID=A0A5J5ESE4_9PEZI|nr:hypothetical protein FN846DRAFT_891526 [Sphaerosporella brunnea]
MTVGPSQLFVFNICCDLTGYISFDQTTRCSMRQLYGHSTACCNATLPIFAVCAKGHLTIDHTNFMHTWKGLLACCASFNLPHKAINPPFPTYLMLTTQSDPGRELLLIKG